MYIMGPVEILQALCVNRKLAQFSRTLGCWKALVFKLAKEHPQAGDILVPADCTDTPTWRRESFHLLRSVMKWSSVWSAPTNFKISVHVRLRPEDTDEGPVHRRVTRGAGAGAGTGTGTDTPAAPRGVRLLKPGRRPPAARCSAADKKVATRLSRPTTAGRMRKVLSEAHRNSRELASDKAAAKPKCPWDRGAPRFSSHKEEAAKRRAEAEAAKRAENIAPEFMLAGSKQDFERGRIGIKSAGIARNFLFDGVWTSAHSQQRVFQAVGLPMVRSTLMG